MATVDTVNDIKSVTVGDIKSVTVDDIKAAAERIAPHVHLTPVLTSTTLDLATPELSQPRHLLFKCELFQKVGAFKIRGATNAILQLSDEEAANGVITHSSGNHAQAIALAARQRNIPAYIVMPNNTPVVKKNAVAGYGGIITECQPTLQAREDTVGTIISTTRAKFIHPFNNPHVIAGQGTLMLEFITQSRSLGTPLDAVIIPVGGGGMLSGCAIAARGVDPSIRIFAAEPLAMDDCSRSFAARQLEQNAISSTSVADGLLTTLGSLTLPIILESVDAVFTVTEEEIVAAMRLVWERMKLLIEPSAATGVAVALFSKEFRKLEPPPKNVGIVLCGGNVDLVKALKLFQ